MLKKTVHFKDWDDKPTSQDLYFHLTRSDVLGELSLLDRFEKFKEVVEAEQHELTTPEKQEMVDLIKTFARLSYGVRLPNGGFRKSEEIWQDFLDSAAWDPFFWQLFAEPKQFEAFMAGILPDDLRDEARKQMEQVNGQEALPFTQAPPIPQPEDKPLKSIDEMSAEELKARLAELQS